MYVDRYYNIDRIYITYIHRYSLLIGGCTYYILLLF